MDFNEPKYSIGQYVRIKDAELRSRYPDSTGLILALVGAWTGTRQGYGILFKDGALVDFREEELEPMTDVRELTMAAANVIAAFQAKAPSIMRELRGYIHHAAINTKQ